MFRKSSLIILVTMLFQIILFGSGLYGVVLENEALLCTCNHDSKKEVHQNEEDHLFKKPARQNMAATEKETVKPSCHSAKTGEVHLCQCKKASQKSDFLQSFLQNNYLNVQKQCVVPERLFLFNIKEGIYSKLNAHAFIRLKPPKTT